MPRPSLAEIIARGRTAVVVQELQNGVVGAESSLAALADAVQEVGLIAHAAQVATAARAVGVPVIHTTAENLPHEFGVNHNARLFLGARAAGAANLAGTDSVSPVAAVFDAGDLVLPRYHGLSPMTGGPLDSLLRNAGISTVVLMGVSLNVAIQNLVFDAVNRSYQVVVVIDAVAGIPVAYGRDVLKYSLGFLATLASSEEIIAAWDDASTRDAVVIERKEQRR